MIYSSPFCPDDDKVMTKNGKMKISRLYYKMNPRRDPYNKILEVKNIFLSKCVSINKDKILEKKIQKQKSLKDLRNINEYYNKINKNNRQILLNPEIMNYKYDDYSSIFQTSIKIDNKTNYKNNIQDSNNSGSIQNDNTNFNEASFNNQSMKEKILNHSHSYVIKLDKTYYKYPIFNRKIYVLNNKNRREYEKNPSIFKLADNTNIFFNDSDMSKYNEIIPLSRQNYLIDNFDFDNSKKSTLTHLKQYQIRETQNKAKLKPFVY